jgi:hypothetical protein
MRFFVWDTYSRIWFTLPAQGVWMDVRTVITAGGCLCGLNIALKSGRSKRCHRVEKLQRFTLQALSASQSMAPISTS